ncbi:FAD-dependent oxidoreductase [Sphingomonas lycopersici]|uniref:FAD-dependent oxidoreductase n=1 Tax=Sphingomonas lycopersici TaxID=2951807 RepID=A0AA41Z7U6_9SPHN|nr:FAD-dependent oxidoreductase [Sphingomonas lycopersici]MCW6534447.1 FAD-dependent oxidoreductase [Sphingomonas lycopersici]
MEKYDIVIVGGGPAGMMAGLLFARAGLGVAVLEKHRDFLRDFRGDTVHPSTLDLFDELGLFDALLAEPHDKIEEIGAVVAGHDYRLADFTHLPGRGRFVALMPQWHFLDFVAHQARRYPGFDLRMETAGAALIAGEGGRIAGVRTAQGKELRARLVILADGRDSALRDAAGLPRTDLGVPIDVFWFRVPKERGAENRTAAYLSQGQMVVAIDRGDYFQCARVIRKGSAAEVRERGIATFRTDMAAAAPVIAPGIAAVRDWDDVKLLSVSLDRLTRWHRPGLLAIGDAAHAMSPVGGVGINLAIQDAVAAANILAAPMLRGEDPDALLAKVQARRMFPVKVIQAIQRAAHRNVLERALSGEIAHAPLLLRLFDRVALLRRIPARVLGLGVRREHIRSPVGG